MRLLCPRLVAIKVVAVLFVLSGLFFMSVGVASASGSAGLVPPMPNRSAPLSTWRVWAAEQSVVMKSVNWTKFFTKDGCTVLSVTFLSLDSRTDPGLPTPPGIITTGVNVISQCTPGVNSKSVPVGGACGTIRGPGSECVNPVVVGGNPSYISASYLYQGSSSATGHVELSNEGGQAQSCYVGSLVANSVGKTLHKGQEDAVVYGPVYYSTVWNSNWWEGGPPWTNWGNVCSSI